MHDRLYLSDLARSNNVALRGRNKSEAAYYKFASYGDKCRYRVHGTARRKHYNGARRKKLIGYRIHKLAEIGHQIVLSRVFAVNNVGRIRKDEYNRGNVFPALCRDVEARNEKRYHHHTQHCQLIR